MGSIEGTEMTRRSMDWSLHCRFANTGRWAKDTHLLHVLIFFGRSATRNSTAGCRRISGVACSRRSVAVVRCVIA